MKFDLNVSIKIRFIASNWDLKLKKQGNYCFLLKVLLFILKRHSPAHAQK